MAQVFNGMVLVGSSGAEYPTRGFVEALERFVPTPVFSRLLLSPLAVTLKDLIKSLPETTLVSANENGLANTVSFLVDGADSIALLAGLDFVPD